MASFHCEPTRCANETRRRRNQNRTISNVQGLAVTHFFLAFDFSLSDGLHKFIQSNKLYYVWISSIFSSRWTTLRSCCPPCTGALQRLRIRLRQSLCIWATCAPLRSLLDDSQLEWGTNTRIQKKTDANHFLDNVYIYSNHQTLTVKHVQHKTKAERKRTKKALQMMHIYLNWDD